MRKASVMSVITILVLPVAFAASAAAAPVPSKEACSTTTEKATYACMEVDSRKVPSGDPVTFTGQLSAEAMRQLKVWTKGDNIACLNRYKPQPEADGSWPWTTLEGACTTVRKNGEFTIEAELGRKGLFYYGLEMGPCRGDAGLCGNADPGLLGVGGDKKDRVIALRTT
jgi:hypothetical protein